MDNIFKYATSELSNDAFLCWLFSISKNDIDSIDYKVSQGYLKKFCKYEKKIIVYKDGVVKQEGKIDVLIKGKYDNGEEFILAIENKTASKEHSDQLKKYRNHINKEYKHIEESNRHFIYYKTAIQGNIDEIVKDGYSVFQLDKIYKLLNTCNAGKSKNDILKNYFDFIKEEFELYNNYKKLNINEWDDKAFQGFFYYLLPKLKEKNFSDCDFGYHDNENGGHWSIWFGNCKKSKNKNGEEIGFHLNLETANSNAEKDYSCRLIIRTDGRKNGSKWKKSDIKQYIETIGEKPDRYMPGKYMILAKLFQIDSQSKIYNYEELEKEIMIKLKQFTDWQDIEGFKCPNCSLWFYA